MELALRQWLETVFKAFFMPIDYYVSDEISKNQYLMKIAAPVLAIGFLGISYSFTSFLGVWNIFLFIPVAYVFALIFLYLYEIFIRLVLTIGRFRLGHKIGDACIFASPYLLPSLFFMYNFLGGIVLSLVSLGFHKFTVARTLEKCHTLRQKEIRSVIKYLLLSEYLMILLLLYLTSRGFLSADFLIGLI